jgi:hypothetical protein
MSCNFSPDTIIQGNTTIAAFPRGDYVTCAKTYLRPDPGAALLPWLFALFMLFFHLPTCVIRAVRWESAQYLALGLALFDIALTIQSYASTKLRPANILVWMPHVLVLDVGAMLQMTILIVETHGVQNLWDAVQKCWNDRSLFGSQANEPIRAPSSSKGWYTTIDSDSGLIDQM